ncbi:MAG: hypothetical protein FWD55_03990 [Propionibacteriaceae bacterium]|nr:hypothetical protein [Propionibacteriaceae bacterium]
MEYLVDIWQKYLPHARWFASKGLPISSVSIRPLPWYTTTDQIWVRSELLEVDLVDLVETYHLLVGYLELGTGEPEALIGTCELDGRGMADVVDVPSSPSAMRALLTALVSPDAHGVHWHMTPPSPTSSTSVFSGEQSNTTVRIGEDTLFKVLRKITPGPNLESATMAALGPSTVIPRLIGTLSSPDSVYELGIFSEWVSHARDGWSYCLEACQAGRSITDEIYDLGVALKALHTNMAEVFGTSTIEGSLIASAMRSRLESACSQVEEISGWRTSLNSVFHCDPAPIQIQRVHGDFHLGQALISGSGWTIIDFEGEPLKSPEERAAPDSVYRDIAGLIRSLDYVRSTLSAHRGDWVEQWYLEARKSFLDGYLGIEELQTNLLRAYEVDKAIYEMVYEARNRPSWTDIPRRAIQDIIEELEK